MGLDVTVGFEQERLPLAAVGELAREGGELARGSAVHAGRPELSAPAPMVIVQRDARRRRDGERSRGVGRRCCRSELLLRELAVVAVGRLIQHARELGAAFGVEPASGEHASAPILRGDHVLAAAGAERGERILRRAEIAAPVGDPGETPPCLAGEIAVAALLGQAAKLRHGFVGAAVLLGDPSEGVASRVVLRMTWGFGDDLREERLGFGIAIAIPEQARELEARHAAGGSGGDRGSIRSERVLESPGLLVGFRERAERFDAIGSRRRSGGRVQPFDGESAATLGREQSTLGDQQCRIGQDLGMGGFQRGAGLARCGRRRAAGFPYRLIQLVGFAWARGRSNGGEHHRGFVSCGDVVVGGGTGALGDLLGVRVAERTRRAGAAREGARYPDARGMGREQTIVEHARLARMPAAIFERREIREVVVLERGVRLQQRAEERPRALEIAAFVARDRVDEARTCRARIARSRGMRRHGRRR